VTGRRAECAGGQPPADAEIVVAAGQVGNQQCEEVQAFRDVLRGAAGAAGVPADRGHRHPDEFREQLLAEGADHRRPFTGRLR